MLTMFANHEGHIVIVGRGAYFLNFLIFYSKGVSLIIMDRTNLTETNVYDPVKCRFLQI